MHQMPLTMNQASVRRGDALTVGFASNQWTGKEIVGRFEEFYSILNRAEEADNLPSEDLFDALL